MPDNKIAAYGRRTLTIRTRANGKLCTCCQVVSVNVGISKTIATVNPGNDVSTY